MRWKKLGRIFASDNHYPWMRSHAANPFAEPLSSRVIRVYFTSRDEQQRSHIASLEFDISTLQVLSICTSPLLAPGITGAFDDSGVAAAWLLTAGEERWMFYLGWNLGVTVPWRNSIGLARLNDGTFQLDRVSLAPVLDRHHVDPFSISYPCVLPEGDGYRMWYGSNLAWGATQESMQHVIKYAEARDLKNWNRQGLVVVPLKEQEYAIAKPCVVRAASSYYMWYSFRGAAYRIGCATSLDGLSWTRCDEQVGIDVSESGWDNEMVCYAHVFDHEGSRYMLYNGNGYGKTGFGLAVMTED